MKYTIESTANGCVESFKLHDGKTYIKRHARTIFGSECEDESFAEQMERDGICEEILEKVDAFDAFLPSDFMAINELG